MSRPEGKDAAQGANLADWREAAARAIRRDAETLRRQTPDGIAIEPLDTAADLEGLKRVSELSR